MALKRDGPVMWMHFTCPSHIGTFDSITVRECSTLVLAMLPPKWFLLTNFQTQCTAANTVFGQSLYVISYLKTENSTSTSTVTESSEKITSLMKYRFSVCPMQAKVLRASQNSSDIVLMLSERLFQTRTVSRNVILLRHPGDSQSQATKFGLCVNFYVVKIPKIYKKNLKYHQERSDVFLFKKKIGYNRRRKEVHSPSKGNSLRLILILMLNWRTVYDLRASYVYLLLVKSCKKEQKLRRRNVMFWISKPVMDTQKNVCEELKFIIQSGSMDLEILLYLLTIVKEWLKFVLLHKDIHYATYTTCMSQDVSTACAQECRISLWMKKERKYEVQSYNFTNLA